MKDLLQLRDTPDSPYGRPPEGRTIPELMSCGAINLDKPQGPSSHQVSAWVARMLDIPKAAHGGTLDPRVTGVLPMALGEAVKGLEALLVGGKEYVGVFHLHQDVPEAKLTRVVADFIGEIYQMPPVRSAVKRELRTRTIHALRILEVDHREVLFQVSCQAGTYVRTLSRDIGEALGVGAHMTDLRRTKAADFAEVDAHSLLTLKDALVAWKEDPADLRLRRLLLPMESLLSHLPKVLVKDTAVDALCHGAKLAAPGITAMSRGIPQGSTVAVLTQKGEGIALGRTVLPPEEIARAREGIAVQSYRVLMKPGTYPKLWT